MTRRLPSGGARGARLRGAVRAGRRAWPVVVMAWERWQALSEDDKRRYKRQAREFAERSRVAYENRRRDRGRRG